MSSSGTSMIIDANNLAARCRYAFDGLTVGGESISVTYGVLKVLSGLISRHNYITEVVLCWDYGKSKKRLDVFPDYKISRVLKQRFDAERDSYIKQMNEVADLLRLLPVIQIKEKGVEADDSIAVLSRQDLKSVIVSADKDLFQLISANVDVLCPIPKSSILTIRNFKRQLGIDLKYYLFYKALLGDPSDSIPGVAGLGEVRAKKVSVLLERKEDFINLRSDKVFGKYVTDAAVKIFFRNVDIMSLGKRFLTRYQTKELFKQFHCIRKTHIDNDKLKSIFLKKRFISFLREYPEFIKPFRKLLHRSF